MYHKTNYQSPLGLLTLVSDGSALVGLWLENQKHFSSKGWEEIGENPQMPVLEWTKAWLDSYFAGEKPDASALPLSPMGTSFQKTVWRILQEIPYGKTVTYGEIAKQVVAKQGKERMSARAVGGAVGRNPISIIIPCHRVVGANGSLTGYAGGIDRKIWLLTHEGGENRRFRISAGESVL